MSVSSNPVESREVADADTLRFFERWGRSGRWLEVGAGEGDLAEAIRAKGQVELIAIDRSEEAVARARARNVEVRAIDLFELEIEGKLDGVIFTRSLHHIEELEAALDRGRRWIRPGGVLLLDELATERIDRATARWAHDLTRVLEAAKLIEPREQHAGESPIDRWRTETEGRVLHTGAEMRAAVADRFDILATEELPFLYRRFRSWLDRADSPSPARGAIVEAILRAESEGIRLGEIQPLGLRIAARVRD